MKNPQRPAAWRRVLIGLQLTAEVYVLWRDYQRYIEAKNARALTIEMTPAKPPALPVPAAPPLPAREAVSLGSLWRVVRAAGNAWLQHRAASKGAALALYTLFSLAPMLILVVAIAGFFLGETQVADGIVAQMKSVAGVQGASAIQSMLMGGRNPGNGLVAGLVSGAIVLFTATSAFAELKNSLDELWENKITSNSGVWTLLKERLLSFGLLLVLALMLLMSLTVSAGLDALSHIWGNSSWILFTQILSSATAILIVTILFAVIFKYLPEVPLAWSDVMVGAILTSILFSIGKALISLYVAHGNFDSTYGAAGSLVALIAWIYYSAQIFFYGSLFTHEYAVRLGSRYGDRSAVTGPAPEAGLPASS